MNEGKLLKPNPYYSKQPMFYFFSLTFFFFSFFLCAEKCPPILISIEDAERIAIGSNTTLEQARLAAERDYWIYRETLGRILPQLTYQARAYRSTSLRTFQEKQRAAGIKVNLADRFTSTLRLDQALLAVPTYFDIDSADWVRVASFYNYMEELIQTLFRIRSAHFQILLNKKLVSIYQDSLDLFKDSYEKERIRVEYGESTEFEYVRDRLAYDNTLTLYYRAVNDLQTSKDLWIRFLGVEPIEGEEYDILEEEFPFQEITLIKELLNRIQGAPQQIIFDMISRCEEVRWQGIALRIRPLLKRVVAERNAAQSLVYGAWGEYLPNIGFFATYNINTPPEAFASNKSFTEVGVELNWTIFDGFARESRIQRFRKERQIRSTIVLEDSHLIQLQVRDASEQLQQSLYTLQSSQRGSELAEKGISMALEGFNLGLFTGLDYRDMVQSFIRAKTDFAQSGYGVMSGYFQLISSIGFADFDAGAQLLNCECKKHD